MLFLSKYPLLEVMQVSDEFKKDEFFEAQSKSGDKVIRIEVARDFENNEQNKLNLFISFGKPTKYLELSFYFNITNKDGTKVTSSNQSLYNRKDVAKYIPKELSGKNIFMPKLVEMLKTLLSMEKPERFFMVAYEDYQNEKQKNYYEPLVQLLLKNGYAIKSQGVGKEKRYVWEFINTATKGVLPEGYKQIDWVNECKRDEAYWEKHNKSVNESTLGKRTYINKK